MMPDQIEGKNDPNISKAVAVWRQLITDASLSWVLFANGTIVTLEKPGDDLEQEAAAVLKRWGHKPSGLPSGDFTVLALGGESGWAVTSHFVSGFDLLTYVRPEEMSETNPSADAIGHLGCQKRELDVAESKIVHVEDRR